MGLEESQEICEVRVRTENPKRRRREYKSLTLSLESSLL